MQQFLTSSRCKVYEIFGGPKFGPKGLKSGPKICFCHFLEFSSLVFLESAYKYSLQQSLTSSRCKFHEKMFWDPNLGQRGESQVPKYVFCHFLKFGSLVFLDIAYNYSLQECITSRRDKTHKINFWDQIWAKTCQNWAKTCLSFRPFSQA